MFANGIFAVMTSTKDNIAQIQFVFHVANYSANCDKPLVEYKRKTILGPDSRAADGANIAMPMYKIYNKLQLINKADLPYRLIRSDAGRKGSP